MKLRITISALRVASLLGFGFNWSVLAASCPQIDNEQDKEVNQCSSTFVVDAAVPHGGYRIRSYILLGCS